MPRYEKLRVLSTRELTGIQEFLSELKDAALFKQRLSDLETLKAQINADIEVYGKAKDIGRLLDDAKVRDEASKKLQDEMISDRAHTAAEILASQADHRASIDDREREATKRWSKRERLLREGVADLEAREEAFSRNRTEVEAFGAQAAADMRQAVDIRTKYTEAVTSLKRAIENTAKAL